MREVKKNELILDEKTIKPKLKSSDKIFANFINENKPKEADEEKE